MEKRIKRIEIVLLLVLILIVVNISFTIKNHISLKGEAVTEKKLPEKPLPDDLTRDILNQTMYDIKIGFNSENWSGIYNVFGKYAKAIVTPEEISSEFSKLFKVTGKIISYNYSHYEYLGYDQGADWFKVYY